MALRDLILRRRGAMILADGGRVVGENLITALQAELAGLGYQMSYRLASAVARCSPAELQRLHQWLFATLAAGLGADQTHVPLFRRFPAGVPADTFELWFDKFLVHYFQAPDQPCLRCGHTGTTHPLSPCGHVVCELCFDGRNYSACPICERAVEPGSPFFKVVPKRAPGQEFVRFKLLDLCEDLDTEARALFSSFCARTQVMSPVDTDDLRALVAHFGLDLLPLLPDAIPVVENRAHIFGALLKSQPEEAVLTAARPHLRSATDVLRLIAVYSSADPSLQAEKKDVVLRESEAARWHGQRREQLERSQRGDKAARAQLARGWVKVQTQSSRFKVARISRPLRRALLGLLEAMPADSLVEDMLRHRAVWVAVGEAMHPFEHVARFPKVAKAFSVVRLNTAEQDPPALVAQETTNTSDGDWRDKKGRRRFAAFYARLDRLLGARDLRGALALLATRPGELARRLDLLLRIAGPERAEAVVQIFAAKVDAISTPVLLGLASGLGRRRTPLPVRVFFPKGRQFFAPSAPDKRGPIARDALRRLVDLIETELLRRFSALPPFPDALIDAKLSDIIVPFNERTASRSAVCLPRGSVLDVPAGPVVRLFLHWCQPVGGARTDIDLSVGFYGADWKHSGVCSYYQLELADGKTRVAASAGDLRDAPSPDGATELVDVHRDAALKAGHRYAVMVVNNYAGLSFSALERGFAGLMVRDDVEGSHFDPRTVQLRFNLDGDNGVFMPLVLDLAENRLFWLDAYALGQFSFNNVANSNKEICRICPETMAYFGSGVRPSMFRLATLHAAARCEQVTLRGETTTRYMRRPEEPRKDFFARLVEGTGGEQVETATVGESPIFAALLRGDLPLPEGSQVYALFPEQTVGNVAAADLLSST